MRAYVRTLGAATCAGGSVGVEVDERAEGTPLPPGLLLTLAQGLLGAIPLARAKRASTCAPAPRRHERASMYRSPVPTWTRSGLAASIDRIKHRVITACGPRTTLEVLRQAPLQATLRLTLIDQPQGMRHERDKEWS